MLKTRQCEGHFLATIIKTTPKDFPQAMLLRGLFSLSFFVIALLPNHVVGDGVGTKSYIPPGVCIYLIQFCLYCVNKKIFLDLLYNRYNSDLGLHYSADITNSAK
jgi:hypothetical protein